MIRRIEERKVRGSLMESQRKVNGRSEAG